MCRKLICAALVALVGMCLLPASGSADLLTNADFEDSVGWVSIRGADYSMALNHTPGGTQCVVLPTSYEYPQMIQDLSSGFNVGDTYSASLYGYTIESQTTTSGFIVGFLDNDGNWMSGDAYRFMSPDSPTGTWIMGTGTGTIPVGTATIRFVVMTDSQGSSPNVYFDDASLTVPEPATCSLLSFAGLVLLAYAWRKRR